ncbi:hypothetical protein GE09DRAFT_1162780 [Coniochaeta sp. 2T2.1]|nr:hypothetical protein GE09DRAFT_1162780 [Coniochaeta sp. 2T2.1]
MRTNVENLLFELPSQITEAYERILGRSKNETQTEILLRIVLVAGRPLYLDEANIALTSALQKQQVASHVVLESRLWPGYSFRSIVKNFVASSSTSTTQSCLSFIRQRVSFSSILNDKASGKGA